MNSRSTPANRSASERMCRRLKSTLSTVAISRWAQRRTRLPRWCKDSSVLHARASRRGGRDEDALRGPVTQLCIWFEPLRRKVIYVGQENGNHNRSIGGHWRRPSRRVSERRL